MSVMHGPRSNHLSKTLKRLIFHSFLGSLSVSPPSLHRGFEDSMTIKAVWAELWMTLRKEWSVLIPGGSSLSLLAEADASSPVAISYGTCAPLKVPDGHSLRFCFFFPNKSLALTLLQAACLRSGIPWQGLKGTRFTFFLIITISPYELLTAVIARDAVESGMDISFVA